MVKMINFIDKNKAELLRAKGFNYKENLVGDTTVYTFVGTPDLLNVLNCNFSEKDSKTSYYVSNAMYF